MIKSFRFLFICCIAMSISVLIQSCCSGEWEIFGAGELAISSPLVDSSEPINQAFSLVNQYEGELVSETFSEFSLINSAWAVTCEHSYKNAILVEALDLTLDRPFTLGNETVAAGTNLMDLEQFDVFLAEYSPMIEITINDQFFSDATFSKGDHTFVLKSETEDGLTFETSLKLDFDF